MSAQNTFTCAGCHGVFEKDWSEEEADAERERNFPGWKKEDCSELCDECYDHYMVWHRAVRPDLQ